MNAGGRAGSGRGSRAGPAAKGAEREVSASARASALEFLRHRSRDVARRDRGAVLVEFAGVFPLILLMTVVIWQCVLLGYTFSLAANAADEGARAAAATSGDPAAACRAAATRHLPSAWQSGDVDCPEVGGVRQAHVRLPVPVLFPGTLDLPLTVHGQAGAAEEGARP